MYRPGGSQCFFICEVRAAFAIDSPAFHAERAGDDYIATIRAVLVAPNIDGSPAMIANAPLPKQLAGAREIL
jgi:hypothetical protein